MFSGDVAQADRRVGAALSRVVVVLVAAIAGTTVSSNAYGQSPENVAVVINESHEGSRQVGDYYVQRRRIPASNVITVKSSSDDIIDRAAYVATIEEPIAAALSRANLQDRILYLVLTKGLPLRIAGTAGNDGTGASVDSELALLYRKMSGVAVLTRGRVDNPYFVGEGDPGSAPPFTHRDFDIFLVSRLDGFTIEDARGLVDRAAAAVPEGPIVLDQRAAPDSRIGDEWLSAAAQRLSAAGYKSVVLETTREPARVEAKALGYYSWGSSDPQLRTRRTGVQFVPGAIVASFVNGDARTFVEPPPEWVPLGGLSRDHAFKGANHSLMGDSIRDGATGVAGHVSEPYLQSAIRPDILFSAYLAGHNLIESFYLAMPHLSWQSVVVGDPLCAPFPRKGVDQSALEPTLDAGTGLPEFFSRRRIETVTKSMPGLSAPAAAAFVRANAAASAGDLEAAKRAYLQAVEAAPTQSRIRLELALLHHRLKEIDAAVDQYRRLLDLQPKHVTALNNLAFLLAVDRKNPIDALPLATRAATLAPTQPDVIDTLGWVEHLLGNDASAAKRAAAAIRLAPDRAEIRLHAAVIRAALGDSTAAEADLKEALQIDPSLEQTEEVQQLKKKLTSKDRQ